MRIVYMSEETKICVKCETEQPIGDFRIRAKSGLRRTECITCTRKYKKQWVAENYQHHLDWNRAWREKHAEKLYWLKRSHHLKRKFGITLEQYEELKRQQGGKCAICRERVPDVVDHDHETKEIRGLLCHPCNKGLGMFRENGLTLVNAALYLAKESRLGPGVLFPNLGVQLADGQSTPLGLGDERPLKL